MRTLAQFVSVVALLVGMICSGCDGLESNDGAATSDSPAVLPVPQEQAQASDAPGLRSDLRPDHQAASSLTPCQCFPNGDACKYPGLDLPEENVKYACAADEICDADFTAYMDRQSWRPRGSCLKACYRSDASPPQFVSWAPRDRDSVLGYDCAVDEECYLMRIQGVNVVNEVEVIGTIGVCRHVDTSPNREPDWR